MCIYFTNLNKPYSNDCFPLLKIDPLVDAMFGHRFLSFLNAFFRYHQINMNLKDEENTAFITDRGTNYYQVMSFGLKMQEQLIKGCD